MTRLISRRSTGKLLALLLLVVCLGAGGALSSASAAPSRPVSPSSPDTDLICHTSNLSDCYPRLFRPTDEFQPVHDDQDLPPGLHVRLNVWTGEKEAKLNDDGEPTAAALAGLPVDHSVVLVDQPEHKHEVPMAIPKGAPAYDPVGLVKEPQAGGNSEMQQFLDAVAVVKGLAGLSAEARQALAAAEAERVAGALEVLHDLAHDIYYGAQLAADAEAMHILLCSMSGGSAYDGRHDDGRTEAGIVAAALQNNPAAQRAVGQAWKGHKAAVCKASGAALGGDVFRRLLRLAEEDDNKDDNNAEEATCHRIRAVSELIKSPAVRADFVASGGLDAMLTLVVVAPSPSSPSSSVGGPAAAQGGDAVAKKAAQLVMDNFLDASMGASVDLFPEARLGDGDDDGDDDDNNNSAEASCRMDARIPGHCWGYAARQLVERHRAQGGEADHWTEDLWRLLQERRGRKSRDEL